MAQITIEQANKGINKTLAGKTIKSARYMTEKEMNDFMWYERGIVIEFTDGSFMIPQQDNEGNGAGALWMLDNKDGAHNETLIGTW
jgi:hypothetical protein